MEGEAPYSLGWTTHSDENGGPTFKSACEKCKGNDELYREEVPEEGITLSKSMSFSILRVDSH